VEMEKRFLEAVYTGNVFICLWHIESEQHLLGSELLKTN
jgi:hypothetical protein